MKSDFKLELIVKAILTGFIAIIILLAIYFIILTSISGWVFAQDQFSRFWYFIMALAIGFGIQVGLYSYLKALIKNASPQVLATTGATSTAAMISCCAHYLTNILPILGATGIITIIGQYQVQFFWIGLFFNLLGIYFIGNKVLNYQQ
ncbi:hypothetical protein HY404_03200 [Candidatus Microgenomates bacterium]|nr:hypothetical protein [Candidatus Microgenomates bacterium]